jgi:hypothetical protein
MRLKFLIFLTTLSLTVVGQNNSFLTVLKINKIVYYGDSIVYDSPRVLEVETSKTSEIIDIGKIDRNHFGIQFEILQSELKDCENYIVGKVFL